MPFVLVEVEVPVDAARVVLGLPDEQADQGQDDKHGEADEDPFHEEQALAGASGLLAGGSRSDGKAQPDRLQHRRQGFKRRVPLGR